jgi:hypothetical protein
MFMLAWNICVDPSPRLPFMAGAAAVLLCSISASQGEPLNLGNQRELFCDRHLIETLRGAQLMLHEPKDEGAVLPFDQPWEGPFSGYCTVVVDQSRFEIGRRAKWKSGADLGRFADKPVRLRFVVKDADLYAIRFGSNEN